jgi:hypothetical protein
MTNKLAPQDDVTVAANTRLLRVHVEAVYETYFVVWPAAPVHDGRIADYNLADEGITWVRGFHERGAPELAALLAYIAMR